MAEKKARLTKREIFFVVALLIGVNGAIYNFFCKPTVSMFPGEGFSVKTFSDATEENGTSVITAQTDESKVDVSFTLKKKYEHPFAGVRLQADEEVNLNNYDYLYFDISVKEEKNIILAIWTPLGSSKDISKAQPHFYLVTLSPLKKSYKVPLASFITPMWWLEQYNIGLNDLPENLFENVKAVGFQSAYETKIGVKNDIAIQGIYAKSEHIPYYIIMGLIGLIGILYLWIRVLWVKSANKHILVPLREFSASADYGNPLTRIISIIGEEYHKPSLTINEVADKSYITVAEVEKLIYEGYGINFSQYLAHVRDENNRQRVAPQQSMTQQMPQQPMTQQVPQQPMTQQMPQQPMTQQVPQQPQQPMTQQVPQQPQEPTIMESDNGDEGFQLRHSPLE